MKFRMASTSCCREVSCVQKSSQIEHGVRARAQERHVLRCSSSPCVANLPEANSIPCNIRAHAYLHGLAQSFMCFVTSETNERQGVEAALLPTEPLVSREDETASDASDLAFGRGTAWARIIVTSTLMKLLATMIP